MTRVRTAFETFTGVMLSLPGRHTSRAMAARTVLFGAPYKGLAELWLPTAVALARLTRYFMGFHADWYDPGLRQSYQDFI
jgi:hypothetical protein